MWTCLVTLLSVLVTASQGKAQYDPFYYVNPYHYPNYPVAYKQALPGAYFQPENRLFWGLFRTTTTTTITTTCTVSTTACPGRRKRFALGDLEDDVAIQPSEVNKVEITPVVEMASRNEREANPQYAFVRGYPQENYPFYELEPTFGQSNYFYSSPNLYANRPPINAADPRWGIYFTTSTVTTTTTSTSRPGCSSASSFNQC